MLVYQRVAMKNGDFMGNEWGLYDNYSGNINPPAFDAIFFGFVGED